MNGIRYSTQKQPRSRTRIGRRAVFIVNSNFGAHGGDFANIVYGTNAVTAFTMNLATENDVRLESQLLRECWSKPQFEAEPEQPSLPGAYRVTPRNFGDTLEVEQERPPLPGAEVVESEFFQGSFQRHTSIVAALLLNSVDLATIQSTVVRELTADDGTRYPMRVTTDLAKRMIGGSFRFYFPHSEVFNSLVGEDVDDKTALDNFAAGFHRLVRTHWQKPPHLHTEADEKVNRILEFLVDWERYREVNPIEQPLWGKIVERRSDESVTVEWVIGPDVERGATTTIKPKDVCSQLREISVGCWFYGSGKVYPSKIEWIDQPVESPDPYDRKAIAQAWDLIPRSVLSETDAWPLRNRE